MPHSHCTAPCRRSCSTRITGDFPSTYSLVKVSEWFQIVARGPGKGRRAARGRGRGLWARPHLNSNPGGMADLVPVGQEAYEACAHVSLGVLTSLTGNTAHANWGLGERKGLLIQLTRRIPPAKLLITKLVNKLHTVHVQNARAPSRSAVESWSPVRSADSSHRARALPTVMRPDRCII